MKSITRPSNFTSEDRFLRAALAIGTSVALLLVIQVVGKFDIPERLTGMVFWAEIVTEMAILALISVATPMTAREMKRRRRDAATAVQARLQIESLFHMTDMLQSAQDHADGNSVLRATGCKLLPDFGGALYVFNNSGDRLDLATYWNWPNETGPELAVLPSKCWAIKRGKANINVPGVNTLRCEHHMNDLTILEIPMMARGEVYGLLKVERGGEDAEALLAQSEPVARAIADAMSLALSNMALREKLRTQALRDPLTGLYNRRYMEDTLDRFANLAERNGTPVAAIMIDLDHFKKLNDEHGHALGDAVLREVAGVLMGGIRPCDVACRYGGEELVVLLPDCTMHEASAKAESLRARIESLSDNHDAKISASFGVASIPETTVRSSEVIAQADRALFQAKAQGRNCVVAAPPMLTGAIELRQAAE